MVLTGLLDDGTAGLIAIQKCGGVAVVQDPKDAACPEMPQSVLNHMKGDHCIPLAGKGQLLEKPPFKLLAGVWPLIPVSERLSNAAYGHPGQVAGQITGCIHD